MITFGVIDVGDPTREGVEGISAKNILKKFGVVRDIYYLCTVQF